MASRWYHSLLTVDDTKDEAGNPVTTAEDIEEWLSQGNDPELKAQEFFCDFSGVQSGTVFGPHIARALAEGRVTSVPANPRNTTFVAMDLGIRDAAAAIFMQIDSYNRNAVQIVDYFEKSSMSIPQICAEFQAKGYVYSNIYLPHDGKVREQQTGKTRVEAFQELGFTVRLVPNKSIQDGLNAVRSLFPRLWFDKVRCERLVHCITQYHKRWDAKRSCYEDAPYHDWSSNACDALRMAALIYDWEYDSNNSPTTSTGMDSSVWGDPEDDEARRNDAGGFRSTRDIATLEEYEVEDPITHRRQKVYR